MQVVPFAGAWIEMQKGVCWNMVRQSSFPSRERGLKFYRWWTVKPEFAVVPFAGAWIEI